MNTKQVNRKELLQLAFFKLVKQGKEQAALSLSSKLISSDQSGSNWIKFGKSEEELEILKTIDGFLVRTIFDDMCYLDDEGNRLFYLDNISTTINIESYEKN